MEPNVSVIRDPSSIHPSRMKVQAAMINRVTNKRYETLSQALRIIDPDGLLVPGTPGHNQVTDMILSWMHEKDTDEVLQMSRVARRNTGIRRQSQWIGTI